MLLTLIVIDNRNEEACHCQRRVVVADCGEPVHMQWKLRNGVGSRVYQKKDEKYPQPPELKKKKLNKLPLLIMYFFTVRCIILRIQLPEVNHCTVPYAEMLNVQLPMLNLPKQTFLI